MKKDLFCPRCNTPIPRKLTGEQRYLCEPCRNEYKKEWRRKNVESARATQNRWYKNRRKKVLSHYSGGTMKCVCCGEGEYHFLTIDHTDGGGRRHRENAYQSNSLVAWLVANKYPEGFRVLCFNCNSGRNTARSEYHGKCPHEFQDKQKKSAELEAARREEREKVIRKWGSKLATIIETIPEPMLEKFVAPNSLESKIEEITEVLNEMSASLTNHN